MNYVLPLSCHHCRGPLRHVNGSRRVNACEQTAIAECESCGRAWSVLVQLRAMPAPESRRRAARRVAA